MVQYVAETAARFEQDPENETLEQQVCRGTACVAD
jgi:hypothetical protein